MIRILSLVFICRENHRWSRIFFLFVCLPTVTDFADISDKCQKSVPDSPDIESGGKWKVRQN